MSFVRHGGWGDTLLLAVRHLDPGSGLNELVRGLVGGRGFVSLGVVERYLKVGGRDDPLCRRGLGRR